MKASNIAHATERKSSAMLSAAVHLAKALMNHPLRALEAIVATMANANATKSIIDIIVFFIAITPN